MSSEELFWSLVDRSGGPDACWPWLGAARGDGYGSFRWQGRGERAHRVALELDGRPVAPGQVGMHLCDNPTCCNPMHLRAGTQRENIVQAIRSGRMHPGRRSLTQEQEANCRTWYRRGLATSDELAAFFGITPQRVRHIGTDEPYRDRRRNGQGGSGAAAVSADQPGAVCAGGIAGGGAG